MYLSHVYPHLSQFGSVSQYLLVGRSRSAGWAEAESRPQSVTFGGLSGILLVGDVLPNERTHRG